MSPSSFRLKAACSDSFFFYLPWLSLHFGMFNTIKNTVRLICKVVRMQELNNVEEGLLPRGSHFKRKGLGVMHLDSSVGVEVTFEALIQKCKSVSHGRWLKGGFVRVSFESSEEQALPVPRRINTL